MTQKTSELTDIMKVLESLQSRVQAMDEEPVEVSSAQDSGSQEAGPDNQAQVTEPAVTPLRVVAAEDSEMISLLRTGVTDLTTMTKLKQYPAWFSRLAERTGLRMLLLKRWTSGLQVFMETNILGESTKAALTEAEAWLAKKAVVSATEEEE